MTLDPVNDTPGLWRAADWRPGLPGLYALVIGVSAYPFLADGTAPAAETYGLGQLQVSARTAAEVFRWLTKDYRRENLSLVWCHLLLSPTPEERQQLAAWQLTHFDAATNRSIREALQLWSGNLPAEPPAARESRSFFFFSGHGVQANWDSLLLPADYLDPRFGKPVLEGCLSAREISRWMETHPAAEHVAFFDACRNEFSPLAAKGSTAHPALPVNAAGGRGPRVVARMAATAPDMVAYQAQGPEGMTFFGQALLEGMKGQARRGRSGTAALQIEFQKLVSYVKPRVNALLKQRSEQLEQPAHPSIEPSDETVILAELDPASVPAARPRRARMGMTDEPEADREPQPGPEDLRRRALLAEGERDRLYQVTPPMPDAPDKVAALRTPDYAHDLLGHEYAADLWRQETFRCLDLRDLSDETEGGAILLGIDRKADSSLVRVDLEIEPSRDGRLLVFQNEGNVLNGPLAVPLPTDPADRVPIRLTLRIGVGTDWKLRSVEARLGPSMRSPHYAYLWELTRVAAFGSTADAAGLAEPARLREAGATTGGHPTAACAGALILARGGRIRDIGDWPRGLMESLPLFSDGAVLWAEALRAQIADGARHPFGVEDPVAEMAQALAKIETRGLPVFAGAIELADQLLRRFEHDRPKLPPKLRASVEAAGRRLRKGMQIARWNGQFPTLSGLPRPAELGPVQTAVSIEEMQAVWRPAPARG